VGWGVGREEDCVYLARKFLNNHIQTKCIVADGDAAEQRDVAAVQPLDMVEADFTWLGRGLNQFLCVEVKQLGGTTLECR